MFEIMLESVAGSWCWSWRGRDGRVGRPSDSGRRVDGGGEGWKARFSPTQPRSYAAEILMGLHSIIRQGDEQATRDPQLPLMSP
jgi:hypothetical protein